MTITPNVSQQMFLQSSPAADSTATRKVIRIAQSRPQSRAHRLSVSASPVQAMAQSAPVVGATWTAAEHERFLEGFERFPAGPWKAIAAFVGTKNARQTMTHAQKYRQKIARRGIRQSTEWEQSHQQSQSQQQSQQQQRSTVTATAAATSDEPSSDSKEHSALSSERDAPSFTPTPPSESTDRASPNTALVASLDELTMDYALSSSLLVPPSDHHYHHHYQQQQLLDVDVADDKDVSSLFRELMQDVDSLADQPLLSASAAMLTEYSPSADGETYFPSWSLDGSLAFISHFGPMPMLMLMPMESEHLEPEPLGAHHLRHRHLDGNHLSFALDEVESVAAAESSGDVWFGV